MRPDVVVMVSPFIDNSSGIEQIPEPLLVQAGVSEPAIKTLDKRILGRFARLNRMSGSSMTRLMKWARNGVVVLFIFTPILSEPE
jgi:hypothetical protein